MKRQEFLKTGFGLGIGLSLFPSLFSDDEPKKEKKPILGKDERYWFNYFNNLKEDINQQSTRRAGLSTFPIMTSVVKKHELTGRIEKHTFLHKPEIGNNNYYDVNNHLTNLRYSYHLIDKIKETADVTYLEELKGEIDYILKQKVRWHINRLSDFGGYNSNIVFEKSIGYIRTTCLEIMENFHLNKDNIKTLIKNITPYQLKEYVDFFNDTAYGCIREIGTSYLIAEDNENAIKWFEKLKEIYTPFKGSRKKEYGSNPFGWVAKILFDEGLIDTSFEYAVLDQENRFDGSNSRLLKQLKKQLNYV